MTTTYTGTAAEGTLLLPPVPEQTLECSFQNKQFKIREWKGESFGTDLVEKPFGISADTETKVLVKGEPIKPALATVWSCGTDTVWLVPAVRFAPAAAQLCRECRAYQIPLYFFNAPFDLTVLDYRDNDLWALFWEGLIVDLEVRGTLHQIQQGTYMNQLSLDSLTRRMLGVTLDKRSDLRLSFKPGQRLSVDQTIYACVDAIATGMNALALPDPYPTEYMKLKHYMVLKEISENGMLVDDDERQKLDKELYAEQKQYLGMLSMWGLRPGLTPPEGTEPEEGISPVSMPGIRTRQQELLKALESQYDIKLKRTEKSGTISTKKEELDLKLIGEQIPFPMWLVASRKFDHARKIRSTYLSSEHIGVDGRVHPRFSPMVKTGRTSCSGPNIQNVPREGGIRGIYIPSPGMLFMATDYAQLEVCVLAQSCFTRFGKSRLRELINSGVDVHAWFGDMLAANEGIHYTKPYVKGEDKQRDNFRQRAKAAIFGFPGGLGAATFVAYAMGYGLHINVEKAEELKALWLEALPEMERHLQPITDEHWTERNLKKWLNRHPKAPDTIKTTDDLLHWLENVNGQDRKKAFKTVSRLISYECRTLTGRLKRNCTFCAAANMRFQGPAADGALEAGVNLWLYGARMVNFVHDEFIQEVPAIWTPQQNSLHALETERIMCDTMMRKVTPDVTIRADTEMMDRWYKEAKEVRDDQGGLLPWNPEVQAMKEQFKKMKELTTHAA